MLHLLQTLMMLALPALVVIGAMRDALRFTITNWI